MNNYDLQYVGSVFTGFTAYPPFFALGKLILYHSITAVMVAWEAEQTE
jgi:hypothetical protein